MIESLAAFFAIIGDDMERMYAFSLLFILIVAPVVFVALFFKPAPYGRYAPPKRGIPAGHAWLLMEMPAVVVIALCFLTAAARPVGSVVLLILWETHYIYRTFIYTRLMDNKRSRRFPFYVAAMAFVFNCFNGFANGYNLFFSHFATGRTAALEILTHTPKYAASWIYDIRFIVGGVIFFVGFLIHVESDRKLRKLRRSAEKSYTVPKGGLFEYVSAPNYFGEIVQWIGWAIASWSVAGLAFAVFTIANLLPRGISHHRWYRDQFDNYPEKRKAVIPFLW